MVSINSVEDTQTEAELIAMHGSHVLHPSRCLQRTSKSPNSAKKAQKLITKFHERLLNLYFQSSKTYPFLFIGYESMVKLASAREFRLYGSGQARNRAEYINAGLYVFATIVLLCGLAAQFSSEPLSGLFLLLFALALVIMVNLHDFGAHLAGIDWRLQLVPHDMQLAFVEFAVPLVQALGSLLLFLAILFIVIQEEKGDGRSYSRLENHGLIMLIAGPALWVLGSIQNSCQIYERSDGHVQILQQSVHIPFLMGSLLFLVAAIINTYDQIGSLNHGLYLLGRRWAWLCIFGSLLLAIGGLTNLLKVFKMQQISGLRLEKLRGGAQEWLVMDREGDGRAPLIAPRDQRRRTGRRKASDDEGEGVSAPAPIPTPYKDVLVGGA